MKLWSTHQLLSKAIKLPGEVQPGCIGINSTILPPTKVPQDCLIHLHRPWISIYLWFINFHSTLFRFLPGYTAAKEEGIALIMISLFMVCSGVSASQDYWYNTPLDLPYLMHLLTSIPSHTCYCWYLCSSKWGNATNLLYLIQMDRVVHWLAARCPSQLLYHCPSARW